MTMDLWYDLAIREQPDLDANVIDPCEPEDAEQVAPEASPSAPLAVDFF
jgi:hypothetical protein